jgi:hypothetical protein
VSSPRRCRIGRRSRVQRGEFFALHLGFSQEGVHYTLQFLLPQLDYRTSHHASDNLLLHSPLSNPLSALVREALNTSSTVRACVTFLRYVPPTPASKAAGETTQKPFLEMVALLDLQRGVNGFAGTAHGGFYGVVLDEVMGTVGNMQAGECFSLWLLGGLGSG